MYKNCVLLPPPLELPGSVVLTETEEFLYDFFCKNLLGKTIMFNGKPLKFRDLPEKNGKPEAFYHIICGFDMQEINTERAKRLNWIAPMVEKSPCTVTECDNKKLQTVPCNGIYIWVSNANQSRKYRTSIFHTKFNYLIILEERKEYYEVVTAYRVDNSQKRKGLIQQYKSARRSVDF